MNILLPSPPGRLLLLIAPQAGGALMMDLVARLAGRGPLRLLDAGNRTDVHVVARGLRRQAADLPARLARIQLARAFTCYQVVTLLCETPARATPTLVLDLLSTFYDESVPAVESQRLLGECLLHLKRLNQRAPVAVSVRPEPATGRPELLQTLQAAASQVYILEPYRPPGQPYLPLSGFS